MAKLSPSIEVRFVGATVAPSEIPLGALSRAFAAVQRIARGEETPSRDEDMADLELTLDQRALRLLGVKKGSAVFQCWAPDPVTSIANIRAVGQGFHDPDVVESMAHILAPVEELSRIARRLKCKIEMKRPGAHEQSLCTIDERTYSAISKNLVIEGESTLVGTVERVGGAEETRCALRLATQPRLLFCSVEDTDGTLVKKLGERLYQDVAASGTVQWLRGSWKIIGLTIRKVTSPTPGRLRSSIDAVRRAGASDWDKIKDPKKFLREVTGEG